MGIDRMYDMGAREVIRRPLAHNCRIEDGTIDDLLPEVLRSPSLCFATNALGNKLGLMLVLAQRVASLLSQTCSGL